MDILKSFNLLFIIIEFNFKARGKSSCDQMIDGDKRYISMHKTGKMEKQLKTKPTN